MNTYMLCPLLIGAAVLIVGVLYAAARLGARSAESAPPEVRDLAEAFRRTGGENRPENVE